MLAAADKYELPSLKRYAAQKLKASADEFWDTEGFTKAIFQAYAPKSNVDDLAKRVLVRVAAKHSPELSERSGFQQLLDRLGKFNTEFTEAMVKKEGDESGHLPCLYCGFVSEACKCSNI
ncbi:BTB/POZ domain-containing protein [Colletotrichum truncatum]|uniref:BTB/POZ domain-containing protein n=1 Tax=Colletotrichum truncatum TaxID=5467 RepID=A0ACC3YH54_COLTU|nr:BTB/POZ domain-containing protein [Colletotrichum truncatum]KAF6792721.1 BTB/POZ domain-containing protein [Colletotrichum truncatum]